MAKIKGSEGMFDITVTLLDEVYCYKNLSKLITIQDGIFLKIHVYIITHDNSGSF